MLVRFTILINTAVTSITDPAELHSRPQPLVMEAVLDANNNLVPGANLTGAENACLSPDGRYIILLTGKYGLWGLLAYDTHTSKSCNVDTASLQKVTDFPYVVGRNALATRFDIGMMWGGDLLLIGTNEGAKLFRFAD